MIVRLYRDHSGEDGAYTLAHLRVENRLSEQEVFDALASEFRAFKSGLEEPDMYEDHDFVMHLQNKGWEILESEDLEFNIIDLNHATGLKEEKQQTHLFVNKEDDPSEFVMWTMNHVVDSGTPIHSKTGEDLEYLGIVLEVRKNEIVYVNDLEKIKTYNKNQ